MDKYIEVLDRCIYYSVNFNPSEFIYDFFGKTKITQHDMYEIDKVKQLRTDFPRFWSSLDDDNKNKFINVVMDDTKKVYPSVKFPKNIILW
jgi:hypothetical protein